MLHIVNKSPFSSKSLESCLRTAPAGDPILLTEDAVLGVMTNSATAQMLKDAMANHKVCVLGPDMKARGVDRAIDGIEVVGYDGFVTLVEQHRPMSWL